MKRLLLLIMVFTLILTLCACSQEEHKHQVEVIEVPENINLNDSYTLFRKGSNLDFLQGKKRYSLINKKFVKQYLRNAIPIPQCV